MLPSFSRLPHHVGEFEPLRVRRKGWYAEEDDETTYVPQSAAFAPRPTVPIAARGQFGARSASSSDGSAWGWLFCCFPSASSNEGDLITR
jgi:hypothetical protein